MVVAQDSELEEVVMEMETEAQRHFHQQVGLALEEMFPETFATISGTTAFGVSPSGSNDVAVEVWPFGDDDALVRIVSVVAEDPRLTPDAMAVLLRANDQSLPFAAFGVAPNGAVLVGQSMLASGVSPVDLWRFVTLIAEHADEYCGSLAG